MLGMGGVATIIQNITLAYSRVKILSCIVIFYIVGIVTITHTIHYQAETNPAWLTG